jgi:hypothetical protein
MFAAIIKEYRNQEVITSLVEQKNKKSGHGGAHPEFGPLDLLVGDSCGWDTKEAGGRWGFSSA